MACSRGPFSLLLFPSAGVSRTPSGCVLLLLWLTVLVNTLTVAATSEGEEISRCQMCTKSNTAPVPPSPPPSPGGGNTNATNTAPRTIISDRQKSYCTFDKTCYDNADCTGSSSDSGCKGNVHHTVCVTVSSDCAEGVSNAHRLAAWVWICMIGGGLCCIACVAVCIYAACIKKLEERRGDDRRTEMMHNTYNNYYPNAEPQSSPYHEMEQWPVDAKKQQPVAYPQPHVQAPS